jgi:hypothetical protein
MNGKEHVEKALSVWEKVNRCMHSSIRHLLEATSRPTTEDDALQKLETLYGCMRSSIGQIYGTAAAGDRMPRPSSSLYSADDPLCMSEDDDDDDDRKSVGSRSSASSQSEDGNYSPSTAFFKPRPHYGMGGKGKGKKYASTHSRNIGGKTRWHPYHHRPEEKEKTTTATTKDMEDYFNSNLFAASGDSDSDDHDRMPLTSSSLSARDSLETTVSRRKARHAPIHPPFAAGHY